MDQTALLGIVGIASTAVVALLGLGLQLALFLIAETRKARLRRYEEMKAVYTELGQWISVVEIHMADNRTMSETGDFTLESLAVAQKVLEQHGADGLHKRHLLQLHGAPLGVRFVLNGFLDTAREFPDADTVTTTDEKKALVEAWRKRLRTYGNLFYEVSGMYLKLELSSSFWRYLKSKHFERQSGLTSDDKSRKDKAVQT